MWDGVRRRPSTRDDGRKKIIIAKPMFSSRLFLHRLPRRRVRCGRPGRDAAPPRDALPPDRHRELRHEGAQADSGEVREEYCIVNGKLVYFVHLKIGLFLMVYGAGFFLTKKKPLSSSRISTFFGAKV